MGVGRAVDPTPAQVAAVLAHLSAEYDAAQAAAQARADALENWFNRAQLQSVATAVAASRSSALRELTAASERHPERFADLAAADEQDLRDLAGYSQTATVASVLRDTATATVADTAQLAGEVAQGAVGAGGFVLGAVLKNIPWPVYAVAGAAVLGLGFVYLRPLLGRK